MASFIICLTASNSNRPFIYSVFCSMAILQFNSCGCWQEWNTWMESFCMFVACFFLLLPCLVLCLWLPGPSTDVLRSHRIYVAHITEIIYIFFSFFYMKYSFPTLGIRISPSTNVQSTQRGALQAFFSVSVALRSSAGRTEKVEEVKGSGVATSHLSLYLLDFFWRHFSSWACVPCPNEKKIAKKRRKKYGS